MVLYTELINYIAQHPVIQKILVGIALWIELGLVLCVVGAVALFTVGQKKRLKPYLTAFLPGGQISYTLRIAGMDRASHVVEHLLWWCFALVTMFGTVCVWAVYFNAQEIWNYHILLNVGVVLLGIALACYIAVRVLELLGLWRLLKRWQWAVSLLGILLFLPIQRVLLYVEQKNL